METLRQQLNAECSYRMKDETMDKFLAMMTEIHLKRNEILLPYDKVDDNIYVVKEGIIRMAYFDGFKEVTFVFGLPGTVDVPYYCFCEGLPSFLKYEACCDSVVMKITKAQFMGLAGESHDFSQWMMTMSMRQLMFYEKKLDVINGDAKERFGALMKNRPEIIKHVSHKIIASYIGVTPQYLSKLKRDYLSKSKA